MEFLYHVQYEVKAYINHIPHIPASVSIQNHLLHGMTNGQFIEQFRNFTEVMKQIYQDMETRPDAYGLPLIDIKQVNENKADGNLAKASWRSVKRLGDVVMALGKHGEWMDDALKINLPAFKSALSKVSKFNLVLNRLTEAGFAISDYDGQKFTKDVESFSVTFPSNPFLMRVVKAYAMSEPYHAEDPHEFYYFDYKRVACRNTLPPHSVANDLAALLGGDTGSAFSAIHMAFTDKLGLTPQYKDDNLEYFLKGKRVARLMIDFHTLGLELILKLKDMDRYIEKIDKLPQNLREVFQYGNCKFCGFQGSTDAYCKYRISWTLDGRKHNACNFFSFGFRSLKTDDVPKFADLMEQEYALSLNP